MGEKLSAITVETKMGEYLQQLKMWDRMLEFYQGLLQQNPDQWINYVRYAEALFEATAQNESALSNAKQFIFDLVKKESESASNKLRGPYLARIYLWQQLHDHKLDASTLFGNNCVLCVCFLHIIINNICRRPPRIYQRIRGSIWRQTLFISRFEAVFE